MESPLLDALLEKNIIHRGTELTVIREGKDLSGVITIPITEILEIQQINKGKIYASSTIDGKMYSVLAQHINNVDGMEPTKLASIYNIKADGTRRPPGKKRGRKSKKDLAS